MICCETCHGAVRSKKSRYCSISCKNEAQRSPIGAVRIRRGPAGYPRAWVKVADRQWRLRAHVVWEEVHGPVPVNHVIHHVNDDSLDDRIENLAALTQANHVRLHKPWNTGSAATASALVGWETRRRNAAIR